MQIGVVSRNVDVDAEVVAQRRLDDLLLDLAVERDRDLLPRVVLPDVDQRVLLGELRERDAQPRPCRRGRGDDDRLQRRRGELVLRAARPARRRSGRRSGSSPRPQSLPISPAATEGPPDAAPRSKTLIAVTLLLTAVAPKCSRSRVRTVPENIRT